MILLAPLLAILLALPLPFPAEETPDAREARLLGVARALDRGSARAVCEDGEAGCVPVWPGKKEELAALLVSVGWHESRFLRRVQAGQCRPGECGGAGHRSLGLFQIEASALVPLAEWRALPGLSEEATERQVTVAVRLLSRGMRGCGSVDGAVSVYATGRTCRWSGTGSRLGMFARVLRKLQKTSISVRSTSTSGIAAPGSSSTTRAAF